MAEILSLEMSGKKPNKGPFDLPGKRKFLVGFAIALLLCMAAMLCWLSLGQIESLSAQFDGAVYTLNAPYAGILGEVNAHLGDKVRKDQVIAVMGTNPPMRQDSAKPVAGSAFPADKGSGPDAPARAEKAQEALAAVRELTRQLDEARNNEDSLRETREQKVLEHVRALLAMRSGKTESKAASEAEQTARSGMEVARENFEEASLLRAAIERKLDKTRQALLQSGLLTAGGNQSARFSKPAANGEEGMLKAPCNGTVIKSDAKAGMAVNADQALFMIQPANDNPESFWAFAWYPLAAGGKIRPGQPCLIKVPAMGELHGKVWEALPPRPMPDSSLKGLVKTRAGTTSPESAIPVRIRFEAIPPGNLALGSNLECEIHTRSFLGFSGF